MESKHTIVTSALPYVNNVPHLGNIVGCVLSADVYARYLRAQGHVVTYVGGVDEYGTATEMKARELGVSCKDLCDTNYALHKKIYDWFGISFDAYGRTSQPNGDPSKVDESWGHTRITHDIYKKLVSQDCIVELEETVWYCDQISAFVADRYILSTCYHCGSDKADGDQCDSCGQLLDTAKLQNARYKPNPEFALRQVQTTNLYLDLPRIWSEYDLDRWYQKNSQKWTASAKAITDSWLEKGLQARSISRDLKWGTRVPDTEKFGSKYSDKVFYVWFDAPIGYLSIIDQIPNNDWLTLSGVDDNHEVVQFMAKDNVPFHSIIFPCTLAPIKSSGKEEQCYSLPNVSIVSTEYLMYEGTKFSKSKGTGLFCDDVIRMSEEHDLDPDLWRAYLIFIRPETADSNFVLNKEGFVDFVNNIIIHNLGNMTHRIRNILFQYAKKHGEIPNRYEIGDTTKHTQITKASDQIDEFTELHHDMMKKYKLRDALKTLFEISGVCNTLINQVEPWLYTKEDAVSDEFLHFANTIYAKIQHLGCLLTPFMPNIGSRITTDFEYSDGSVACPTIRPNAMFKPLKYLKVD